MLNRDQSTEFSLETTVVYTQEFPTPQPMFGIGHRSMIPITMQYINTFYIHLGFMICSYLPYLGSCCNIKSRVIKGADCTP